MFQYEQQNECFFSEEILERLIPIMMTLPSFCNTDHLCEQNIEMMLIIDRIERSLSLINQA